MFLKILGLIVGSVILANALSIPASAGEYRHHRYHQDGRSVYGNYYGDNNRTNNYQRNYRNRRRGETVIIVLPQANAVNSNCHRRPQFWNGGKRHNQLTTRY